MGEGWKEPQRIRAILRFDVLEDSFCNAVFMIRIASAPEVARLVKGQAVGDVVKFLEKVFGINGNALNEVTGKLMRSR